MAGVAGRSGRPPLAKPSSPQTGPINAIEVQPSGKLRPLTYWGGKGLADVRTISGRFLLSFQDLWQRRGDEILDRVADEHPELILLSQIKLVSVTRIEVSDPDDFSKLKSKQEIVEKLEEKAGPQVRQLFEKFISDVKKLEAEQEQEAMHADGK
jgi:hypothetical protein